MEPPKNDRTNAVARLCLALESFRRTEEGRVRDAKAFLAHFFPGEDRLFCHMPKPVRADLLSGWGIRGKKSALRDDDERVRTTVQDALAAGDIDDAIIEGAVTPDLLIDWVPLPDWWRFWRSEALPLLAVKKALSVARSLALFDERWFLEHVALPSQNVAHTDALCAGLSKSEAMQWLAAVHASGDASPAGLVAALGWDTIVDKTAHEALLHALDALAESLGLASAAAAAPAPAPAPKPTAKAATKPPPLPARPLRADLAAIGIASQIPEPRIQEVKLPPMRPKAATLSGVGPDDLAPPPAPPAKIDIADAAPPASDPAWMPPRAEPGDMGYDIVHGIQRRMSTHVQPKYNFEDDEPTSEIAMPGQRRR